MELKELFIKREEDFKNISGEIFDALSHVIEGSERFVSERGADASLLEWDDINFLEDDDVVLLSGSISYKPGDTVILPNGEEVVVSENTATYFKAMLRLGIPYELATTASTDEIYKFLKETIEVEEVDEDGQPNETHDGVAMSNELSDGFDLNELTESQKQAMALFNTAERIRGNKN